MTGTTSEDRARISSLHVFTNQQAGGSSSGSKTPAIANMAKPGGPWKNKVPTPINTPSNQNTSICRPVGTPYSKSRMGSVRNAFSKRPAAGNPTAQGSDLTANRKKKRDGNTRTVEGSVGGRKVAARGNPNYHSKVHIATDSPPGTQTIDLVTDEDDNVTPSDPLNIGTAQGADEHDYMDDRPVLFKEKSSRVPSSSRNQPWQRIPEEDSEVQIVAGPPQNASTSASAPVSARHSTPTHTPKTRAASSPIEDFTSPPPQRFPPPSRRKKARVQESEFPPAGHVKNLVKTIETNGPHGPHINLREVQREKVPLKPRMKGKTPFKINVEPSKNGEPLNDPLSAPTFTTQNKISPYFQPRKNPVRPLCSLPIAQFFLGNRLLDSADWTLTWDERDQIMFKAGNSSKVYFVFHRGREIDTGFYVPLIEVKEDVHVIVVKLRTHQSNRKIPGTETFFDMNDPHDCPLVFSFDRRHPGWNSENYNAFLEWLVQGGISLNNLGTGGVHRVLRAAESKHEAWLKEHGSATRSLKRPHPGDETLDDETPPPEDDTQDNSKGPLNSRSLASSRATTEDGTASDRQVRRSSRIRPTSTRVKSTPQNPDEVILCYPQGVPGAINITFGDLARLEPSEFLNDTLIEFGLKLWLQRLEKTSPDLVKQIHVFSSFFYKKLNRRDFQQGYDSVRKWTAKIDIFSKKYIIIPINENFHWYLAIIYHPEYVLLPPPPPPTRESKTRAKKAQLSQSADPIPPDPSVNSSTPSGYVDDVGESEPAPQPEIPTPGDQRGQSCSEPSSAETAKPSSSGSQSAASTPSLSAALEDNQDTQHGSEAASEASVRNLLTFPSGCTAEISSSISSDSPMQEVKTLENLEDQILELVAVASVLPSSDMEVDQPIRAISPTLSDMVNDHGPPVAVTDTEAEYHFAAEQMDIDLDVEQIAQSTVQPPSIPPSRFYGSRSKLAMEKRREISEPIILNDEESSQGTGEVDPEPEEEASPSDAMTYIFTLDSLGSKHPQAIKQLSQYLQKEAEDKKGLTQSSPPSGRKALVPAQPNYCDCGLYVLHFAETFMTDPDKYAGLIKRKSKVRTLNNDRKELWHDAKTAGMRESLKAEIIQLATEWKKERTGPKDKSQEGGKATNTVESSDDEVDIVATNLPPTPVNGRRGKDKATAPAPVKGKAARLRG